jgi:uncharacterized repeat protein (TIGR01451 family)
MKRRRSPQRVLRQPRRRTFLCVEFFEERCLLTNFPVTVTTDGGPGSLRQAILDANNHPGPNTITLPPGTYTITIPPTGTDDATTGDFNITNDLTISGAGASTTIIDGGGLDNVFHLTGAITASFSGLTIRNAGGGPTAGVGILSDQSAINVTACTLTGNTVADVKDASGNVDVANSTVSGTNKTNDGVVTDTASITVDRTTFSGNALGIDSASGAITVTNSTLSGNNDGLTSAGTATLTDCSLSGNSHDGVDGSHTVTATNCHFDNNSSGDGVDGSVTLTATGSTFSGNGNDGIDGSVNLTVTNCSINNNRADGVDRVRTSTAITGCSLSGNANDAVDGGSGLMVINSTFSGNGRDAFDGGNGTITFSTIADNVGAGFNGSKVSVGDTILSHNGTNCLGPITSLGNNISSDNSSAASFNGPGDLLSTDAKIGPLANNGGPTETRALLPGSPAIDAASSVGAPATDQRGVSRPQGAGFDIGAFELQVAVASADLGVTSFTAQPQSVPAGQDLTFSIALKNNGPDSATNALLSVPVPNFTTFVSLSVPTGWTPSTPAQGGTGTVTASLASLANGATANFTLVVRVDPGTQGGTTISTTAAVSSDTADTNSDNNSLPAQATVAQVEATAPTIVSVQRFGFHAQPTQLVLTFSEPLDPETAQNTHAYRIVDPHGHTIALDRAVYNPESQTVTLFPHRQLNLHLHYLLVVAGVGPNAVTSNEGVPLDGANNGHPGSNFTTLVTINNWVRPLPVWHQVARRGH